MCVIGSHIRPRVCVVGCEIRPRGLCCRLGNSSQGCVIDSEIRPRGCAITLKFVPAHVLHLYCNNGVNKPDAPLSSIVTPSVYKTMYCNGTITGSTATLRLPGIGGGFDTRELVMREHLIQYMPNRLGTDILRATVPAYNTRSGVSHVQV